jgi:hypothetical protein
MTMLSKLQALEASIAAFFSHAKSVSTQLSELKTVLGVVGETAAVMAPNSGVAEAVNIVDNVANVAETMIDAIPEQTPAP